jgi:hypothetical protein
MSAAQWVATALAVVVVLLGLRFLARKAIDDFQRQFYTFDPAAAERECKELLEEANKDFLNHSKRKAPWNR